MSSMHGRELLYLHLCVKNTICDCCVFNQVYVIQFVTRIVFVCQVQKWKPFRGTLLHAWWHNTTHPRKSGPGKPPTNMVLYYKMLWTRFLHLHILLWHCLPIISKKQEWFSSISFQDVTLNVNLYAEPFLSFFCWEVDWQHTKQVQKVKNWSLHWSLRLKS